MTDPAQQGYVVSHSRPCLSNGCYQNCHRWQLGEVSTTVGFSLIAPKFACKIRRRRWPNKKCPEESCQGCRESEEESRKGSKGEGVGTSSSGCRRGFSTSIQADTILNISPGLCGQQIWQAPIASVSIALRSQTH